jgi:hypothetical protein
MGTKMIFHMWRLSEGGEDNLALACTADGLVLGHTRLIERRNQHFVVRERSEIERLLRRAYETEPPIERIMPGLATVARALNADDQCLARIAAVHLRIPDLPSPLARSNMEAEDCLLKYARDEAGGGADWDPAKHPRTGTPPNPGWFAPTDGGDESSSTRTAANDDPTHRSDASPTAGDDWVHLRPGPKRIDELADFVEWMANAKPEDEQAIRAEIKRYFYDAGDQGSAAQLNSALTALLRPDLTRQDRQKILDYLDVFTRADPAEYAHTRDWTAGAAIAAGGVAPGASGEGTAADSVVAGSASGETASQAWKLGWAARGNYFSEQLGANLPTSFPVIDKWIGGVATSIKSIDLNATTYQDATRLIYRLNAYVDNVATFDGGKLAGITIDPSDISGRVLDLAVPKGSMTESQRVAIDAARARAQAFGVELRVTEF